MTAERTASREPPALFHYTTRAGLLGMVETKKVWASSIHHLNDASEFKEAIGVAQKLIQARMAAAPSEARAEVLRLIFNGLLGVHEASVFVFCMTELADSLSQWRAYSGGGEGYSVSLDFSRSAIQNAVMNAGFGFSPCLYTKDEHVARVTALLDGVLAMEGEPEDVAHFFRLEFIKLAPILKNRHFAEEREWRLISGLPSDLRDHVKFRDGKTCITPYVEIDFSEVTPHIFEEVMVGPSTPEVSRRATSDLVFRGFARWVRKSAIPYRNW